MVAVDSVALATFKARIRAATYGEGPDFIGRLFASSTGPSLETMATNELCKRMKRMLRNLGGVSETELSALRAIVAKGKEEATRADFESFLNTESSPQSSPSPPKKGGFTSASKGSGYVVKKGSETTTALRRLRSRSKNAEQKSVERQGLKGFRKQSLWDLSPETGRASSGTKPVDRFAFLSFFET